VAAPPAEPGHLAAEARYVRVGSGTAELALTVRDGYQGAGMGRLLLEALVKRAHADGFERLRAVVLLSNTPMRRLGLPGSGPTLHIPPIICLLALGLFEALGVQILQFGADAPCLGDGDAVFQALAIRCAGFSWTGSANATQNARRAMRAA
jgi:GNAT superfamily N-acetyltransferase